MTPKEIQTALREITMSLGPKATAAVHLSEGRDGKPVYASVYPFGLVSNEGYISVYGETFEGAITELRTEAAKYAIQYVAKMNRKMALAIIRLTDQLGACTDAALRDEFAQAEIIRFGKDACALANSMAAKGPFEIVTVAGANGAPGEVVELKRNQERTDAAH